MLHFSAACEQSLHASGLQFDKMSEVFCSAIVIGVLIMLASTEVDAQSTVDDSASCESSTFDEAVNLIREDLKDVKNHLSSNQNNASCVSKEDLKTALASFQQRFSGLDTSSLCEYRSRPRAFPFPHT